MRVISNDLLIPAKSGFQCERTLVKGKIVQAGQLKCCIKQWEKITSDKVILDIVRGHKIDFVSVPTQNFPTKTTKTSGT